LGGRDLGFLFARAAAAAEFDAVPNDTADENLRMLGTALGEDLVVGGAGGDRLEDFLEVALGIDLLGLVGDFAEHAVHLAQDESAGGVEAAIEVNRAGQGFEGVGERGGALAPAAGLFAPAHHDELADFEGGGAVAEGGARHNACAEFRQLALAEIREHAEEVLGDGELDDGVTEEFEPLVVEGIALPFERNARVREGFRQQQAVAEFVENPLLERVHDRIFRRFQPAQVARDRGGALVGVGAKRIGIKLSPIPEGARVQNAESPALAAAVFRARARERGSVVTSTRAPGPICPKSSAMSRERMRTQP
jgi:hypothetical protein